MKKIFLLTLFAVGLFAIACNDESSVAPSLQLSQSTISAWYNAETFTIKVQANCAWDATCDSDWATIQSATDSFEVSLAQNDSAEERTTTVTVAAKEHSDIAATLTITQSSLLDDYFKLTYTSTNGNIVTPYDANAFGATIVSNTYENGVGTILFDAPITRIGEAAFYEEENHSLKSITLPNSVIELGSWAFDSCIYMEQVTLSNRLKTIGDAAFSSCSKLKEISLPESLTTIGEAAFFGCNGMSGYYGKFASEDNRCLVIDNVLLHFAPKGLTEYVIPDGVTTIAFAAFYESTKLQNVTIPTSITSIEDWAFYYCENLKSVYCKPTTPPTLGEGVFDNYDGGDKPIGCKIYVPEKSVNAYKEAENWKRYKSYIYGDEQL